MAPAAHVQGDLLTFEHVLLAKASNQSRHPRASVSELRAILCPAAPADYQPDKNVGAWWEAQLVHYGLKPSKSKAVAKNRLSDAVKQGTLAVPDEVAKLETQLKKIWMKKEREKSATTTPAAARNEAKSSKRKTEGDNPATEPRPTKMAKTGSAKGVSAAAKGKAKTIRKTTTEQPAKLKAENSKSAKTAVAGGKPRKTVSSKKPDSKTKTAGSAAAASSSRNKSKQTPEKARSVKKNDVKRSEGSLKTTTRPQPKEPPEAPPAVILAPRTKQTARKSIEYSSRHHFGATRSEQNWPVSDDDPLDMTEDETQEDSVDGEIHDADSDEEDEDNVKVEEDAFDDQPPPYFDDSRQVPGGFRSLGLINGTYNIDCPSLEEWDYTSQDFSLILTLDGEALWGAYDFGMFSGILHLQHRPRRASDERLRFTWRGREHGEDQMSFGPSNVGWIEFRGQGQIRGMINCYGEAEFVGTRTSRDETRSPRRATDMRHEWEGYNESEYERENRARW